MDRDQELAAVIKEKAGVEAVRALRLLERIVGMESGSHDIADVNRLGDFLAQTGEELGGEVTRERSDVAGDPVAVTFNCQADSDVRRILMICHRDTVFPHGTLEKRPFRQADGKCYGPGVADMKGGIVIALSAARILKEIGAAVPLELLFCPDEEIGSSAGAPFIARRCRHAKAAFMMEPARANGKVVTGRDGGDLVKLEAFGRSSHAGNAFEDGVSAVHGLCAVVAELAGLSDAQAGYSTNVGLISGGDGAIIVAPHAEAEVYTRFSTVEQRGYLLTSFERIARAHSRNGLKITLSRPVGFLPFLPNERNQSLFDAVRQAGEMLGVKIEGMNVRGAADAGVPSCAGIPTICGMGPVGGGLHTDREFMVTASLEERLRVAVMAAILADRRFS